MSSRVLLILAAGAGKRFGGDKQLAPIGPAGEALVDYTVDGARRAGFDRIVVVTRPDLESALRGHLTACTGSSLAVVHQPSGTFGTVPAVLAARSLLGADELLSVVNADDLYPSSALAALRCWTAPGHALIGFRLGATVPPGSGPVNRALCHIDANGRLVRLAEASIGQNDGGFVACERGAASGVVVSAQQLVSMNAWTFRPSIWRHLEEAMPGAVGEVLLPVAIGAAIARGTATVSVVPVEGTCIGLTWPGDVPVLRDHVAGMVALGRLPARLGAMS